MGAWRKAKIGVAPLAVVLALVIAVSAAFAATKGPVFGGRTAQGIPIVFELTASKKVIRRIDAVADTSCSDGRSRVLSNFWVNRPIRPNRTFRAVFRETTTSGGVSADWNSVMTGRLNSRRTALSGTWRVRLVIHDPGGDITCDSGALGFRARD